MRGLLRSPCINRQEVPVERSIRRCRHVGHQFLLLVTEVVEAATGDVLKGRALMQRNFTCEGNHFFAIGVARGDGFAIAI